MSDMVPGLSLPPLTGLGNVSGPGWTAAPVVRESGQVSFQDLLLNSLEQVSQLDQQTQAAVAEGVTGGDLTQAEIMISMRKTELAYKTLIQIRNKLLEAYQELQQLRI